MPSSFVSNGRTIRLDTALPTTPGPHPALLLLHGSGGNTGFWLDRIAPFVQSLNLALFAVHYFDSTNTTRADPSMLTDGIHVPRWLQTVRDALAHIAQHPTLKPHVDPTRIALVGISLGAYMALALGTEPNTNVKVIIEISGGLIAPWNTRVTPNFPPTLILHGEADTVVPIANARALDALLTRHHVPHQTQLLPREGHWFSLPASLQMLATINQFLNKHL